MEMGFRARIIGVAATALLGLSAGGVSAAQAASSLDIGAAPAVLTAETFVEPEALKLEFKKETGEAALKTLVCKVARFEAGTPVMNVTGVSLTPSYSECTMGGPKAKAEVKVNGCKFFLTSTSTARVFHTDIECGVPAFALEIIQGSCVVKIRSNTNVPSVEFENTSESSPPDLLARVGLSMFAWEGGSECPAELANVKGFDGELSATTTVRAFKDLGGGLEGVAVALVAT
jgi:hypothetical protein